MSGAAPRFSVVVPSRGEQSKLLGLIAALGRQTLPRGDFEILLVLDGAVPSAAVERAAEAAAAAILPLDARGGPGRARNDGAERARGEWLAFTEDDCEPAPDWLERAAARLDADATLDVLEGDTLKPGGRPVRVAADHGPAYLPTNLFVRRELFTRVGGYHEAFFDARTGIYFREDSDFGFSLEEASAGIGLAPDVRVRHPDEHPRFLDPLRWARRYEMDALLAARHPQLFHERIEVHRFGPLQVRRPIVRACVGAVLFGTAALVALALGQSATAGALGIAFALLCLPLWAKWGFDPRRLPVVPLVPFVLVASLVRGSMRTRSAVRKTREV